MEKLYSDLYYLLNRNGIKGLEHIHKLERKQGRQGEKSFELRKDVFESIEQIYDELSKSVMPIRGVSLCIDASAQNKLSDVLVRKCLLYGETSTILVKGAWKVQGPRKSGSSFSDEYDYVIPRNLVQFLIKYQSLVEDGLVVPIPNEIKVIERSRTPVHLSAIKDALPVSLKNEAILSQLTESELAKKPSRSGYANLLLPSLSDCSIDEVRELRHDLQDSFLSFHRQLRTQLKSTETMTGEQQLLELMMHTDEQVKMLNSEIESAKKTKLLKTSSAVAGFLTAVICAITPSSFALPVAKVLGPISFTKGLTSIGDLSSKTSEFERNNFYFPWKIGFKN